ncbi:MAG: poly-beta-1,6-N-acetyl-D-glucosamine biosynthesis protein PgaD [Methylococcales bacterium]|nr:poly-beta-1,6-N-acetyl-D-glucosamine biosynthesis protein PgaD [Methylococcales bacterium]
MRPLIINAPALQSLLQKLTSYCITLLFWFVWLFFCTPIFSYICWMQNIDVDYLRLLEFENYDGIIHNLILCFFGVLVMGGGLSIWSVFNLLRFKHEDRRASLSPLTINELSEYFKIDKVTLTKQQQIKCLSVSFDEEGNIVNSKELV